VITGTIVELTIGEGVGEGDAVCCREGDGLVLGSTRGKDVDTSHTRKKDSSPGEHIDGQNSSGVVSRTALALDKNESLRNSL